MPNFIDVMNKLIRIQEQIGEIAYEVEGCKTNWLNTQSAVIDLNNEWVNNIKVVEYGNKIKCPKCNYNGEKSK